MVEYPLVAVGGTLDGVVSGMGGRDGKEEGDETWEEREWDCLTVLKGIWDVLEGLNGA